MRIRKAILSLLISGVSLGSVAAQIKDSSPATMANASRNAKRISDDATPAVAASGARNNFRTVQYEMPQESLAPAAMSYSPGCDLASCGVEQCSIGCDSGCGGCGASLGSQCGCRNMWFGAETLLWWGQNRNAPALLATSQAPTLPILGLGNNVTTVVGGDQGIDSGLLPGYRLTAGMCFGPEQLVGVSGRFYGIYRSSDTISRTSNATTTVGLPFFDVLLGTPNAFVAGLAGGPAGTASVTNRLNLLAAEPSLRLLMGRSDDHRLDLLGGYSFLKLEDSLSILTHSPDPLLPGNANQNRLETNDLFSAKNLFHGGHIGLQSTVSRSRISLTTLTKVALGNMHQTVDVSGRSVTTLPPNAPNAPFVGGVYTQKSNVGNITRDTFAFVPELGIKGGLMVRNNMKFTVGYTFLFVSKAALAGNQIDPNIDFSQAGVGQRALQPGLAYREGSMWFQGVDLGLNWTF